MFVYTIQPVVKPVVNRFDKGLYRVYKHSTGCETRLTNGLTNGCILYTAGCQTGCRTRFDNRLNEQWLLSNQLSNPTNVLYRVNGVLGLWTCDGGQWDVFVSLPLTPTRGDRGSVSRGPGGSEGSVATEHWFVEPMGRHRRGCDCECGMWRIRKS